MLFQDFIRYFFTIEDNISFGNVSNKHDKDKIQQVTHQANINEYIKNLPNIKRIFRQIHRIYYIKYTGVIYEKNTYK